MQRDDLSLLRTAESAELVNAVNEIGGILLRLPDDLRAALTQVAAADERSLHQTIVRLLRQACPHRRDASRGHP
jgi:hypothetical protein